MDEKSLAFLVARRMPDIVGPLTPQSQPFRMASMEARFGGNVVTTTRTRRGPSLLAIDAAVPIGRDRMGFNEAELDSAWLQRPIIGLSAYGDHTRYGVWAHQTVLLPHTYIDVVVAAGGAPLLLPPVATSVEAVDRLDGVVLTGGPDISPDRYGAPLHPRTGALHPERDAAEIAILYRALESGIPVLGVCRGAQLLNVALGGTLTQHLPDVVRHDGHNPMPGVFGEVTVMLDPAGRVGAAVGTQVRVHCHHHQALDQVAPELVVTGRAVDGTVEAVELDKCDFVVGVQWHPEQDTTDLRLITALVDAARRMPYGACRPVSSARDHRCP
jgi:gamma-glutamyl-gamma-aminobutyrate hydrolase PuuD